MLQELREFSFLIMRVRKVPESIFFKQKIIIFSNFLAYICFTNVGRLGNMILKKSPLLLSTV